MVPTCKVAWLPPCLISHPASPTNLLGTSSQAHQLVISLKVKWRWDSGLKVYWTVQNADCSLTADHCFYGSKAMGLSLSCSHLHGENNGLQQLVCSLYWPESIYGMWDAENNHRDYRIEHKSRSGWWNWWKLLWTLEAEPKDSKHTKTWRQAYNVVASKGASWHLKGCCWGEGWWWQWWWWWWWWWW